MRVIPTVSLLGGMRCDFFISCVRPGEGGIFPSRCSWRGRSPAWPFLPVGLLPLIWLYVSYVSPRSLPPLSLLKPALSPCPPPLPPAPPSVITTAFVTIVPATAALSQPLSLPSLSACLHTPPRPSPSLRPHLPLFSLGLSPHNFSEDPLQNRCLFLSDTVLEYLSDVEI